ncbi:MAG: hypothetical protein ABI706_09175 [Ilumatobacteraceae bacterium]
MEPFYAVAEMYAKRNVHGLAYSALPNAPAQPYTEPRHRLRRVATMLHRSLHRPAVVIRPARYSTEC